MSAEANLIELLEQNYNEDELRYLCVALNIPYESISGDNNKRKALEIVGYMQRRGRLDVLIKKVAQERPNLKPELNNISKQTTAHSPNNRVFILIATGIALTLVLILGVWGASSFFSPETTPSETAVPTTRFLYQVRVRDNANQPIENAYVTIDLPGTTPIYKYTDSTGLAALHINNQYAGRNVVLHVTKDGYEDWDQNITIAADERPYEIKLPPVP